MAVQHTPHQTKTTLSKDQKGVSHEAPKTRVVEAGEEPIQAGEDAVPAFGAEGKEAIEKKDREEYRHGGIPLGSDPRE